MCLFLLLFQVCYCFVLSSSSSLPPFCSCRLYTSLNPNYPHVSHLCQSAPFLTRLSSLLCQAHFCKRFNVTPHLLFFMFAEYCLNCSLSTSADLVKRKPRNWKVNIWVVWSGLDKECACVTVRVFEEVRLVLLHYWWESVSTRFLLSNVHLEVVVVTGRIFVGLRGGKL